MKVLFNTSLKSQKSSRIVYKQLVANKNEKAISCIDKWHKDICSSTDKMLTGETLFKQQTLVQRAQN